MLTFGASGLLHSFYCALIDVCSSREVITWRDLCLSRSYISLEYVSSLLIGVMIISSCTAFSIA